MRFIIFWKDKIDINYINYLGPNVDSVIKYYQLLLDNTY